MNSHNCRFAWLLSVSLLPTLGLGPTYAQEIPASSAGLVISEIFYNPQGSDDFEFVEFYNAGTSSLNLSGFELVKDDKGDGLDFEFAAEVLQPGAYILVAEDSVRFTQRYMTAGSPYFKDGLNLAGQWKGGLRDSGEKLQVLDPDGELIFTFTYRDSGDWPLLAAGMGSSLELKVLSGLPADLGEREKFLETPGNWRASSEFHGNPGRVGQLPDRRVVINEVLANTDAQVTDTIELYNPTSVEVSVGGWFLSDSTTFDKFRIPDGTTIPALGFLTFDETQFNPNGEWNPNAGSPGENEFSLSGSKGDDVWLVEADIQGNALRVLDTVEFGPSRSGVSFGRWPDGGQGSFYPSSDVTIGLANAAPWAGPVVISEIQYNPSEQPDADSLEFLEVYNPGQAGEILTNWEIAGGVEFAFAEGIALAAGEFLLVVDFDPAGVALLQAFRDHYNIDDTVQILGPWKGSLSNSGETLFLKRRDTTAEKIVDEKNGQSNHPLVIEDVVSYADGGQWPSRPDGGGQSLERKDFIVWGGNPDNWRASKEFKGNPGGAGLGTNRHILINETLANSGISGGAKIDQYVLDWNYPATLAQVPSAFVTNYLDSMQTQPCHFSLFHFAGPDAFGHGSGWGSDAQKSSIEAVDAELGRIFELVESEAQLAGKTAVILTSDHGGGGGWLMGHTLPTHADNFTIPFYVWGPGVANEDLYGLNSSSRTAPDVASNPTYAPDSSIMPIRNGAVANLALSLLKLPPVPGSWINYKQDLSVGSPAGIEYIIAISVDGLRPKEIQELGEAKLPNFYRFRKEGAWTDNARTDVSITLTLPNHTSMLTGRGTEDVDWLGLGHRQTANTFGGGTLHLNIGGEHMASVFDVVHDNGLRTSLQANKSKLDLFKASYQDVDTGVSDSIELYNPTGADVDLGGWYLSDSEKNLKKYRIPDGTVLKAGACVVFNEKDFNPGYGANAADFALSGSKGDEIYLCQADASGNLIRMVDSLDFGPSPEGVTLGRDSDGGGSFRYQKQPTLGQPNGEYRVGSLVLNEVMYLPDGSDDFEFVEIHNTGAEAVQLDTWQLSGVGDFTFPQGQTLDPNKLLVLLRFDPGDVANISRKTAFEKAYGITIGDEFIGGYEGGLGKTADELKLLRPGAPLPLEPTRIPLYYEDEVAYASRSPWPGANVGESLHRSNPTGWGSAPSNWSAGKPTPGVLATQLTFTEWAAVRLQDVQNATLEGDPDKDGLANLLEFALGMDPALPDVVNLPYAEYRSPQGEVSFIYQLERAAGGVQVRIEYTRQLGAGWQDLTVAGFPVRNELLSLDGTMEKRRVVLPASEKRVFLRVVAEF